MAVAEEDGDFVDEVRRIDGLVALAQPRLVGDSPPRSPPTGSTISLPS